MTDNAVAATALIRLGRLRGDKQYEEWARASLSTFVRDYERYGLFAAGYALAVEQLLSEPLRVVVVGSAEDPGRPELLRAAWQTYAANRVLLAVDPEREPERLQTLGYPAQPVPRAYLCVGQICAEPVSEAAQVTATIKRLFQSTS